MTVEGVLVVVPAHDEEHEIEGCLRAIGESLGVICPTLPRRVVVVDDGSLDATAVVARRVLVELDVPHDVVPTPGGNVGRARDVGFRHGLDELVADGVRPQSVWCVTTDADCRPIPAWVATHLAWAGRGADGVAGLVAVRDWTVRHPRVAERWRGLVTRGGCSNGHGHVHGANLGWRASAALAVGGVPHLTVGEDHALWNHLVDGGWNTRSVADIGVTTSARRSQRAPGGFSSLLDHLELAPVVD